MRRISCLQCWQLACFTWTAFCSSVHPEQVWTTVSQSKEGEPFYRLSKFLKNVPDLYDDNISEVEKSKYLDSYNYLKI